MVLTKRAKAAAKASTAPPKRGAAPQEKEEEQAVKGKVPAKKPATRGKDPASEKSAPEKPAAKDKAAPKAKAAVAPAKVPAGSKRKAEVSADPPVESTEKEGPAANSAKRRTKEPAPKGSPTKAKVAASPPEPASKTVVGVKRKADGTDAAAESSSGKRRNNADEAAKKGGDKNREDDADTEKEQGKDKSATKSSDDAANMSDDEVQREVGSPSKRNPDTPRQRRWCAVCNGSHDVSNFTRDVYICIKKNYPEDYEKVKEDYRKRAGMFAKMDIKKPRGVTAKKGEGAAEPTTRANAPKSDEPATEGGDAEKSATPAKGDATKSTNVQRPPAGQRKWCVLCEDSHDAANFHQEMMACIEKKDPEEQEALKRDFMKRQGIFLRMRYKRPKSGVYDDSTKAITAVAAAAEAAKAAVSMVTAEATPSKEGGEGGEGAAGKKKSPAPRLRRWCAVCNGSHDVSNFTRDIYICIRKHFPDTVDQVKRDYRQRAGIFASMDIKKPRGITAKKGYMDEQISDTEANKDQGSPSKARQMRWCPVCGGNHDAVNFTRDVYYCIKKHHPDKNEAMRADFRNRMGIFARMDIKKARGYNADPKVNDGEGGDVQVDATTNGDTAVAAAAAAAAAAVAGSDAEAAATAVDAEKSAKPKENKGQDDNSKPTKKGFIAGQRRWCAVCNGSHDVSNFTRDIYICIRKHYPDDVDKVKSDYRNRLGIFAKMDIKKPRGVSVKKGLETTEPVVEPEPSDAAGADVAAAAAVAAVAAVKASEKESAPPAQEQTQA